MFSVASQTDTPKFGHALKKLVARHDGIAKREDHLFALTPAERAMGSRPAMLFPTCSSQGLEYVGRTTALRPRPTKGLGNVTLQSADSVLDRIEDLRGHLLQDFWAHSLLDPCLEIAFSEQGSTSHVEREVERKIVRFELSELAPLCDDSERKGKDFSQCPAGVEGTGQDPRKGRYLGHDGVVKGPSQSDLQVHLILRMRPNAAAQSRGRRSAAEAGSSAAAASSTLDVSAAEVPRPFRPTPTAHSRVR